MSEVATCPTCGSKSKINEKDGETTFQAVQDEEAFKKIEQLKNAMQKFKAKAEALAMELKKLKKQQQ